MKRLIFYIGVFTCIAGLFLAIQYAYAHYEAFLFQFFYFFGIVSFVALVIWSVLRLKYGKNWIIGSGKDLLIGSDLIGAINKTLNELPKPSRSTLSLLGAHIIYRFTRIGILGLLIGSIPIVLLWQQNKKLDIQNDKINIQNSLIEAERRSSLVFLMSNVLDKVDDEIKGQQNALKAKKTAITKSTKYNLSKPLINRIVALSKTFKPYRMLDGDTLSSQSGSPERGQLFSALMQNNLDRITQNTIVNQGTFKEAIIGKVNLRSANFRSADLSAVDLQDADLSYADLRSTEFHSANLEDINFYDANLANASFRYANLQDANFREASLGFSDFSSADLHSADFNAAKLGSAKFNGANLSDADFTDADLRDVDFSYADLNEAIVTKEQLLKVYSLYNCRNLSPELRVAVQKKKACLFALDRCE